MKPLRPGTELTFNLVAENVELFQIHEFAELLRQLSCKKSDHINTKSEALRPDAELTSQIVVAEIDLCHRVAELANVGRKHQPCVSFQPNGAVLDEFPAQKSNRDFA